MRLIAKIVLVFLVFAFYSKGQTFNKRVYTGSTGNVLNLDFGASCLADNDTLFFSTGSILYGTDSNKISFLKYNFEGYLIDSTEYIYSTPVKLRAPINSIQWNDTLTIIFTGFTNTNSQFHNYWLWVNDSLKIIKDINHDPSNLSTYTHNIMDALKDGDSLVCVGQSTQFDPAIDVFIQKYDSAGNPGSVAYFGGSGNDTPVSIKKTTDGGYLISGYTTTGSVDSEYDAFIYKVDAQFNLEWDYYWQNPDYDCPLQVEELSNGSYIASGCESVNSDISDNDQELFSMILDGNGNFISKKGYILPTKKKGTSCYKLIKANDGNYVILGHKFGKGVVGPDEGIRAILLKVNENGDSLYYREYTVLQDPAGDNYLRDIKNTSDGGFVMSGFLHPQPGAIDTGYQDLWLMKTNCLGFAHDPVASATWGNLDNYTIRFKNESQFSGQTTIHFGDGNSTIQQEGDTSFIIHSYAGTGPYQVMVVGEACGTYDTVYYSVNPTLLNTPENEKVNVVVYPNPTSNKLYLEHPDIRQYDFQIYNLSGQVFDISQSQQSHQKLEFDVSRLPSGQYVVVGVNGEKRLVERFSVMRN